MIQDLFSIILVDYYIEKCENVLKFTFHDFAAHLQDYVSARCHLETSFASKFIIFFQWKLTSHTLWLEKLLSKRAIILARLKLQIYTCEQKIHFLLSKSKIGAFNSARFKLKCNFDNGIEKKTPFLI